MQFQVPQFIEVEDKIFGPLSFKQFIYLAGGGGLSFFLFKAFPIYISIFIIVPVAGLSIALAFKKINNRPFIDALEAGFRFVLSTKLYIWKKRPQKPIVLTQEEKEEKKDADRNVFVPRLSESKLKDIAWGLDIQTDVLTGQSKKIE